MTQNYKKRIKLDRISQRNYQPESEVELAALTRFEKINTTIVETPEQGAIKVAEAIAAEISRIVEQKGQCVLGLGAGKCALAVYDQLVKLYFADKVSFAHVIAFNLSELGIGYVEGENQSTIGRLRDRLFSKVDIDEHNIHTYPADARKENIHQLCTAYEREISDCGGIDIVICELTKNGSLALNEPGSGTASTCRLVLLGSDSRVRIADAFNWETPPTTAITLGIANLLQARQLIAVAWGDDSADAVYNSIEGRMNDNVPATFMQMHPNAHVVADLDAAGKLTRISYPWKVASCEWNDKLIRRAIVWLCNKTGKPVLKLTNKDYTDNGLGELVALYTSAYNVNIKIFNDLQHTITGWPGGKPNADDTYRPERATPYPKRVLAFGPHPDDVVVSMGGTLRRLVEQHHDVHVAFETDGFKAVDDDDLLRSVNTFERVCRHFGWMGDDKQHVLDVIRETTKNSALGDGENEYVRAFKGAIFTSEGLMGCRYMGVPRENVHELRLPFYVDDPLGHGRLSEADAAVIARLIRQIRPHQIFISDDQADPYGVSALATQAVLMAIDMVKDDDFMRDCRVWLYIGQWGQWDVDQVEMAVPMSPEEFRYKRDAILKHQTQIHDAPFRDSDDGKLSWQQALDRNQDLAELYRKLGLATYEAMEAFAQYHPQSDQ